MENDSRAFVVKAMSPDVPTYSIPGVYEELQNGKARIGWSYDDRLDLRKLKDKMESGIALDEKEEGAKRCLGFLTRPNEGDVLLYPNQPERGCVIVVEVAGDYVFGSAEDSIDGDFRSYRLCKMIGKQPIAFDDEVMPSSLRYRLGRQGRFSEIYDTGPVHLLIEAMDRAGRHQGPDSDARHRQIRNALKEKLPELIRHQFAQHDFSRRFCRELFERMGFSTNVQEGPAEQGSDLVITVTSPVLLDEITVGVQAFAYQDEVSHQDLQTKLNQLLEGWEANGLDRGLLVTTGTCGEPGVKVVSTHNGKHGNRPVKLIDAPELADLYLSIFGSDPLG